jgi:hypothetical protein
MAGRIPSGAPRKDTNLTIPIESRHAEPLKVAARMSDRAVAAYIRNLLLVDLQAKGLIDANFEPIEQTTETVEVA